MAFDCSFAQDEACRNGAVAQSLGDEGEHLSRPDGQRDGESEGRASYTVDGDSVVFVWGGGNVARWTVRVDSDGALHLEPQGAIDPGDVFVTATHP